MKKRLTKAEEEVMLSLWELKETTVRDVLNHINQPDTPYTTISTVIRVLEKKGFVSHKAVGTTYLYFPLIKKEEYLKHYLSGIVTNYFNGSVSKLASFFAKEANMDLKELKQLIEDVEGDLNKNSESDD